MSSLDQAYETQLKNIQTRTGKTLEELGKIVDQSGLSKHSEVREMLKRDIKMGHGDANTFVHYWFKSDGERAAQAKQATTTDVLDEIYTGTKGGLRPIHDQLMGFILQFGNDFEIVPKKGYVSLRRKKQFAMIGPATQTSVEIGLNHPELPVSARVKPQPPGGMCNYKIRISSVEEADDELISWVQQAYDRAG
jgi:hypothetical protein